MTAAVPLNTKVILGAIHDVSTRGLAGRFHASWSPPAPAEAWPFRSVTARSDIYSLGLTLYDMFTGKSRSETATDPSEIVKDLDPAVERVFLRCLEDEPKRRPASALQVAMALPGGDPIAAALAVGQTPSQEMVAAECSGPAAADTLNSSRTSRAR